VSLWLLDKDYQERSIPTTGHRRTIKLGQHLHMVAVTVESAGLIPGEIYSYDMRFLPDVPAGASAPVSLVQATGDTDAKPLLSYFDHRRPTFCLPPADLTQLRIVHGSCRKPLGGGDLDALSLLDGLIAEAKNEPLLRPQQLLLTGDQIYADEVAAGMLTMITDAAVVLLNHGANSERIPIPPSSGAPANPATGYVPPGSRGWALAQEMAPYQRNYALGRSGFTSNDLDCHLISLGEYLCMYLFVWSDVLWDSGGSSGLQLPSAEAIFLMADALKHLVPHPLNDWADRLGSAGLNDYPDVRDGSVGGPWRTLSVKFPWERDEVREKVKEHNDRLVEFHHTLKAVRRALANIPSYMIFDDHEITDDWNMRLKYTAQIHESPLGRRVIQNGLVAYALCQHWGNRPEEFLDNDTYPPGMRLLQLLDGATGAEYESRSSDIGHRIGLPPPLDIRRERRMFHPPDSLTYNYTIEGPAHQVVVTDTRTWREYPATKPGSTKESPKDAVLLGEAQMMRQLCEEPAVPPLGKRTLLVVLTTNAPPIRAIRTAEKTDWFIHKFEHMPDLYEAWVMNARSTDLLFKRLSDRLPRVGERLRGHVLLLSGDVHHSFATQLYMNGGARIDDPATQRQPVDAVFTQLVSSALRNQDENTLELHREGHDFTKPGLKGWTASLLIPKGRQEVFYGWNVSPGVVTDVAKYETITGESAATYKYVRLKRSGTIGGEFDGQDGVWSQIGRLIESDRRLEFIKSPDWSYNLFYRSVQAVDDVPPLPPIPLLSSGGSSMQRRVSAFQYTQSLRGYVQTTKEGKRPREREVVGKNNICEITFDGPADNRRVRHTVRWSDPRGGNLNAPLNLRFATFTLSLKPIILD
jgi:PhoD-like phosphatase